MPERPVSRPVRWARVFTVIMVVAVAATACGALGWWQWERARAQAVTVTAEPEAPLAHVLEPATSPGAAIGRQVSVTGQWADDDAAIIWGREVDGESAVFLVRPLRVSAEHTGTGRAATIAVLVGWSAADGDLPEVDAQLGDVVVTGYLRAGESANPRVALPESPVPGTFSAGAVAPSAFAQAWEAPLYAAVLVSDEQSGLWQALPPRESASRLDFRSVAYAIEWWIFGAFFVFIGAKWIRDNGRVPQQPDASSAPSREENA